MARSAIIKDLANSTVSGVVHQRINGITYEMDKCVAAVRDNA